MERLKEVSDAPEVEEFESPNGLLSPAPVDAEGEAVPVDFDEVLPVPEVVMVVDGFGANVLDTRVVFGEDELEDDEVPLDVVDEVLVLFVADFVPKPIRA